MRIACILELGDSDVEGGRDIATKQLVQHLRDKGAEVDVFSFENGIPHVLPRIFRETPVLRGVTAFPLAGRMILKSLGGRYDIFYLTSTSTASFYRPSTTTVLYCHGIIASKWEKSNLPLIYRVILNRASQRIMAWFEKRCIKNLDAIVSVSQNAIDYLDKQGIHGPKRYVLPNGVDTQLFSPAADRGEGVIFVGRASLNKGFDTLLEAAPLIEEPVTAVVSKISSQARKEAERAGVEIITRVPHKELLHLYRRSSVFVLPSLDEEHPLTTLEAMACGLPMVVSQPAAADMISNGDGGLIVPTNDPHSLAHAVNSLLGDDEKRKAMGRRNRQVVEDAYTWDKTAQKFLEICRELLGYHRE